MPSDISAADLRALASRYTRDGYDQFVALVERSMMRSLGLADYQGPRTPGKRVLALVTLYAAHLQERIDSMIGDMEDLRDHLEEKQRGY